MPESSETENRGCRGTPKSAEEPNSLSILHALNLEFHRSADNRWALGYLNEVAFMTYVEAVEAKH